MSSAVAHTTHLLSKYPNFLPSNNQKFNFNTYPTQSLNFSLSYRLLTRNNSLHPKTSSQNHPFKNNQPVLELVFLFIFSFTLLFLRLFSNALLPDFPLRWRNLVAFAHENEPKTRYYPLHLRQAIVAYEDRRFFSHFGVDPVGISRAILSFSALGGGSTITQQLVKNTFLKNERTVSRKIVEMVLAIALERVMSKWEILSSYMSKIYWGHGIYGIESASAFYFRKHPSLLSLGESAMLAGIVPAPELRSPLRDCSRGKTFQARVLKRMVEVGFIDVEKALLIVKESLHLHFYGLKNADRLLYLLSFSSEGIRGFNELNQAGTKSAMKDIWDWEQESKIWEACEDMERWAINKVSKEAPPKISSLK
ncbi:hypothetical protein Ddye_006084 [Dipteronia dyeriana]|uniref:Glycosyl transferase family 51 domain-containing protein n=1 Tax=Dipteronia dyeriana TaxID=168575 RepID=A0AAD9XHD1_9ROSI|nr:hypothetical protein Ddye_006084 [Dipteronia dyeriana]